MRALIVSLTKSMQKHQTLRLAALQHSTLTEVEEAQLEVTVTAAIMSYHNHVAENECIALQFYSAKVQDGSHGGKNQDVGKALRDGPFPSSPQLLQSAYVFLACGSLLYTQRQPQTCSTLPQSVSVLLIQCSGLGHLFPSGRQLVLYSCLLDHRVSSCWPALHHSSILCLFIEPELVFRAPVKHAEAFESAQWH